MSARLEAESNHAQGGAPALQPIDPVVVNAVLIAVRQAANVLCDRWTLHVLLLAHAGTTRFADFRERSGAASRLLSSRLAMLEAQEVIVRLAYTRRPLRHGYHLTHMGLALFDVFTGLLRWEQRWHATSAGPGLSVQHLACGAGAARPELRCAACAGEVSPREVDLAVSQKGLRQMPARATAYRRSAPPAGVRQVDGSTGIPALPLPHALGIFGDKWSIEVVMCAFVRVASFSGFQAHTGMSTNILTDRLTRLCAAGILEGVTVAGDSTRGAARGAYRLSAAGRDLFPVLVAIEAWADAWLRDRARSPLRLTHAACGQRLQMASTCGDCGQPLLRGNCQLKLG